MKLLGTGNVDNLLATTVQPKIGSSVLVSQVGWKKHQVSDRFPRKISCNYGRKMIIETSTEKSLVFIPEKSHRLWTNMDKS